MANNVLFYQNKYKEDFERTTLPAMTRLLPHAPTIIVSDRMLPDMQAALYILDLYSQQKNAHYQKEIQQAVCALKIVMMNKNFFNAIQVSPDMEPYHLYTSQQLVTPDGQKKILSDLIAKINFLQANSELASVFFVVIKNLKLTVSEQVKENIRNKANFSKGFFKSDDRVKKLCSTMKTESLDGRKSLETKAQENRSSP